MEKNIKVNIEPVAAALRTLICADPTAELTDAAALECSKCMLHLFELMGEHPEARGMVLQQIGIEALAMLGHRSSAQLFSTRAINEAKGD